MFSKGILWYYTAAAMFKLVLHLQEDAMPRKMKIHALGMKFRDHKKATKFLKKKKLFNI